MNSPLAPTGGKIVSEVVDAMRSMPLAIALLLINVFFLTFAGYMLGKVASASAGRDKTQNELITKLVTAVTECRQEPAARWPSENK